MNKKSTKMVFAFVLAMIMLLGVTTTAFAATADESVIGAEMADGTNESGIMPYSYESPKEFTFTTSNGGDVRTVDGRYLAYECTITNSNSPYVKITTYVDGNAIRSDRISGSGKVDWIDMGYSGEHKVKFVYATASEGQSATVKMVFYTWN